MKTLLLAIVIIAGCGTAPPPGLPDACPATANYGAMLQGLAPPFPGAVAPNHTVPCLTSRGQQTYRAGVLCVVCLDVSGYYTQLLPHEQACVQLNDEIATEAVDASGVSPSDVVCAIAPDGQSGSCNLAASGCAP